jgi:hypothetical protein
VLLIATGYHTCRHDWQAAFTAGTGFLTGVDPAGHPCHTSLVSISEIIKEIDALPKEQRAGLIEYVHQLEEGEIPDSFKQGMADIEAGRVVDMETALNKPPHARR